jgi:hypothetical protein
MSFFPARYKGAVSRISEGRIGRHKLGPCVRILSTLVVPSGLAQRWYFQMPERFSIASLTALPRANHWRTR